MKQIEQICSILQGMGLAPAVDDNLIIVRFEMKTITIGVASSDADDNAQEDKFVTMLLGGIYEIDDESEMVDLLLTCNKLNRDMRQVKTFITEDLKYINSSFEFWYCNEDDLKSSLGAGLFMFSSIKSYLYTALHYIRCASAPEDADGTEGDEA